jgi:hypothetical protein
MDDDRRPRLTQQLTAACIALPFLLAVAAHAVGSKPGPMAAAPARPALAFDQYLVDLGLAAPSEEVFAHFDFVNRGQHPVTITDIVPSCSCLKPTVKKKDFQPGASGNFFVRVLTANENAGQKEYRVTVKYTDPEPRETDVTFRVMLPDNQVSVKPRALTFYQLGQEPTTEEIEVIDRRSRHLTIKSVESSRSIAQVEVGESDIDEAGHWHGRLRVTVPGNVPPGRIDAVIHIVTDDETAVYHFLRVPLMIYGRPKSPIVDKHFQPASGTENAPADR